MGPSSRILINDLIRLDGPLFSEWNSIDHFGWLDAVVDSTQFHMALWTIHNALAGLNLRYLNTLHCKHATRGTTKQKQNPAGTKDFHRLRCQCAAYSKYAHKQHPTE